MTTVACNPEFSRVSPIDQEPPYPAPSGHRPRLVIADDDPVVQLLLSTSLGPKFEVVGLAADGQEAIDLVRTKQPDVALVDVVMPRGGGARAVRGILEVAPGTAIVMLSGHNASAAVSQLLQAGAVVYRRKGVQADVLAEALAQSIETHKAERRESAWRILSCYRVALDHRSASKRAAATCRGSSPASSMSR